jgi:glucose-1-phosphate adenylyltransferase
LNRRGGGVRLLQPFERQEGRRWYQGTGDALRQNLFAVDDVGAEQVLVLPSELLTKMDYSWLLKEHLANGAGATLAVGNIDPETPSHFGWLTLGDGDTVTGFSETRTGDDEVPFLGLYVFRADYLREILAATDGAHLFLDALRPRLGSEDVRAYRFGGAWHGVADLDAYLRVHQRLLGDPPVPDLDDPDWRIYTRSEERAPVWVGEAAEVEDSLLANGAEVHGTVVRSVLSPGVRVEPGAEVRESVILGDVVVEAGARVERAIVDKYTRIGAGARVGGEGPVTVVGEWSRVEPGAEVPPGSVIPPREPDLEEIVASRSGGTLHG